MKKILLTIAFLLIPALAFAVTPTTSGTINWEFQENGTTNDSGGFDYNNANMDATLTATGGTGNTCTVSSSNYTFVAGDVGNWVYIQGGANWLPGWYKIGSISGSSAVLNSAIGQAVVVNTANGGSANNPYSYQVSTVAGCASTATPSAGVWSVDYTQTTSPYKTDSTLASLTGTTNPSTVTDVGLSFGVNTVGNTIHITAGTSWLVQTMEIVSVSSGTATLDRACGSAATLTSGTYFLGGAMPAGSFLTAFLANTSGGLTAGNIAWFKYNATAYTLVASETGSGTNCTATNPCNVVGYNTTHGDNPNGTNRPSIANGVQVLTLAQYQNFFNFIEDSNSTNQTISLGGPGNLIYNSKITNSVTSAHAAINIGGLDVSVMNNEIVCQNGTDIAEPANSDLKVFGNYMHDSNNGITTNTGASRYFIGNNIFESITSHAINDVEGFAGIITNNTFYNTETPSGTGILLFSSATGSLNINNNVFYGFTTAISGTSTQLYSNTGDYNDYFNNTTNYSLFSGGPHDTAINPNFTSAGQVVNLGTVSTSSTTLTDTGASFTSALIGQYLHITATTGGTTGIYLITANPTGTTLTVNNSLGTGSAVTYYITTKHNYLPTASNLNAFPGAFQGGFTTGYLNQGAVQKQSGGGTCSQGYIC